MINSKVNITSKHYNTLFIIQNRSFLDLIKNIYNKDNDLILTIDLAVKKEIEAIGGHSEFLDHLADKAILDDLNYKMLNFIDNWFIVDGKDNFQYKGVNFGNCFKLNILNDVTYTVHFLTSIMAVKDLHFEKIICGVNDKIIKNVISEIFVEVEYLNFSNEPQLSSYYFPISKWMNAAIEKKSMKAQALDFILLIIENLLSIKDFLFSKKRFIYINNYYPTREIIKRLETQKQIRLVLNYYNSLRSVLYERKMRFPRNNRTHKLKEFFSDSFQSSQKKSLKIENKEIAHLLYKIIEPIVLSKLSNSLNTIDRIRSYFDKKDLRLMVPVTDLWLENRLLMNYCFYKKIPVYTIINGLLTNNSYRDGFDSTWVNAYSVTIKEDYYLNASNILCLGDARMDFYANQKHKTINLSNSTIIIGTSGYNPIDLNSYLAVEYDFLFDILSVLKEISKTKNFKVVIKVRTNGYLNNYIDFVNEYFSGLNIEIIQNIPFVDVIKSADLYISIYSQTLFEAACLGIPTIYYKKDTETNSRPFDGKSELVTAFDPEDLRIKILKFYNNDDIYKDFLKKEVLEKYIGPLDGRNCERNIKFISSLIDKNDINKTN